MGTDLEDLETRLDVVDIEVSTHVPQSTLEEIAQATKSETDAGLPEDLQLYYSIGDELTYHAGCIVKGNRVIVPEALRKTILQRLHGAHLGMSKMKAHTQENVYRSKMYRSIESFVLRCRVCQEVGTKCNAI